MKKRFTIAMVLILAVIVAFQCGCMCVHAVKTGGSHRLYLKPTGVWTNNSAHVMIECTLLDMSILSRKSRNLGTRLVCASPATWDKAIHTELEKQKWNAERYRETNTIDHIFLRPSVSLSITNSADLFSYDFVLFPPNITIPEQALPPTTDWARIGIPRNGSWPWYPLTVGNQPIIVFIDTVGIPNDAQTYKDWWWYPNQILLVPAYIVDVVTSPIQFLFIMHSLGKIDG